MGTGYLIDSDAIIGYLAGRIPAPGMKKMDEIVNVTPHISVISKMEVLRFNDTPENEQVLIDFVGSAVVHPLDEATIQRTIAIAKLSKIKLPDAIIAATALLEGRTVVTRNVDDFKHVRGLALLCPWDIT